MNPDSVQLTNTEELKMMSEYAGDKKQAMIRLEYECTDMGVVARFMDSKFPGVDNSFLNLFCLKRSDKDKILKKISEYEIFYKEMSALALEATSSEGVSCAQLRRKIFLLKKRLSELYESAKHEEQTTSSYAICKMHRSFIYEYNKLNWVVKDFENAALSEMLTAAQNGWRAALEEMNGLREQLSEINDKYNDICRKFDAIKIENEKAAKKQDDMITQNKELKGKVDEIMEYIRKQNSSK